MVLRGIIAVSRHRGQRALHEPAKPRKTAAAADPRYRAGGARPRGVPKKPMARPPKAHPKPTPSRA
jgi:hypothetical protein